MKNKSKKLLLLLFIALLCGFSCGKNTGESGNDDDSSIFDFTSDRDKAVVLITDANGELKRIKILYTENREKLNELKDATKAQDLPKVKEISNDLVYTINDGFIFADSARSKIEEAQNLEINQEFKDYLALKEESLDKQVEAFRFLHEAARVMRDSFGSGNKEAIESARLNFLEKEKSFQAKMEEARKVSEQGDELYKETMNKGKN